MERKTRRSSSSRTRSKRREIRRRKRRVALLALLVGVIILGFLGFYVFNRQSGVHVTAANSHDVKDGYRSLEIDGKKYTYNNKIKTVLVALVDSEEPIQAGGQYGGHVSAASIHLVLMDNDSKRLRVLGIPAETVTTIKSFSADGRETSEETAPIGKAYANGDGGEKSGINLLYAVQSLLGNVPVNQFVVANRNGISWLNEYLDGITVEVPDNDLAMLHMDFYEGNNTVLTSDTVADFILYRGEESFLGIDGFAARQKSFLDAALPRLREKVQGDPVAAAKELNMPENAFCSSIGASQYLSYLKMFLKMNQGEDYYVTLEGETVTGENSDGFHADEEALQRLVLDLFYKEG